MPIPDPWGTSPTEATQDGPPGSNGAREREPERDRARAREANPAPEGKASGEVLPFPGTNQPLGTDSDTTPTVEVAHEKPNAATTRWRSAATAWAGEARESVTAAVDGSVWRARPPALRDIHARLERAEWAGDIPALRVVGQGFGYLSLALTAVGYGLLWIARRPSRLLLTVLITVLVVVLAI